MTRLLRKIIRVFVIRYIEQRSCYCLRSLSIDAESSVALFHAEEVKHNKLIIRNS